MLLLVLADHHGVIGSTERQRATAEQARTLLAEVIEEEPSDPEWRAQLAHSHDLIAGALAREWQVDAALAAYRAALAIREQLAAGDPGNVRWQREIALSHAEIGDMLRRQGQWGPALDAYRAAVTTWGTLVPPPHRPTNSCSRIC